MTTLEYIAAKLVSGRFLLTLIVGFTFAYLSCKSLIPPSESLTIIAVVITFYFSQQRADPKNSSNGDGNGDVNGNGAGIGGDAGGIDPNKIDLLMKSLGDINKLTLAPKPAKPVEPTKPADPAKPATPPTK